MLFQHASVDKVFQHAISQSQARDARQAIPACMEKDRLYKRGWKSPKQWTS